MGWVIATIVLFVVSLLGLAVIWLPKSPFYRFDGPVFWEYGEFDYLTVDPWSRSPRGWELRPEGLTISILLTLFDLGILAWFLRKSIRPRTEIIDASA